MKYNDSAEVIEYSDDITDATVKIGGKTWKIPSDFLDALERVNENSEPVT